MKDSLQVSNFFSISLSSYINPITGLDIHDGHTAFAVDAPGRFCNAPRIVHDLQPKMVCPFSVWWNHAFKKLELKYGYFSVSIAGMS